MGVVSFPPPEGQCTDPYCEPGELCRFQRQGIRSAHCVLAAAAVDAFGSQAADLMGRKRRTYHCRSQGWCRSSHFWHTIDAIRGGTEVVLNGLRIRTSNCLKPPS